MWFSYKSSYILYYRKNFLFVFLNVIFINRSLEIIAFYAILRSLRITIAFCLRLLICAPSQNSQPRGGFIIFRMGLSKPLVLMSCTVRHYAPLRLRRSESVPTRNIHESLVTTQTVAYGAHLSKAKKAK